MLSFFFFLSFFLKPQAFIRGERTALQELSERDDIVIINAEKGGAVVIIVVKNYIREVQYQLKNKAN